MHLQMELGAAGKFDVFSAPLTLEQVSVVETDNAVIVGKDADTAPRAAQVGYLATFWHSRMPFTPELVTAVRCRTEAPGMPVDWIAVAYSIVHDEIAPPKVEIVFVDA